MRNLIIIVLGLSLLAVSGCSLPPEKRVTRHELYKTNLFTELIIRDSPESVLATLNREGEAVLEGKSRFGDEYYVKILATDRGLKIRLYAK